MAASYVGVQMRLPIYQHPRCPWCGGPIAHGERCWACPVCGYQQLQR